MPNFAVDGSCSLAQHQLGSLVIHHESFMYGLDNPLQKDKIDKFSIDDDSTFHVYLTDGTHLVLRPKSKKEVAKYHAAHREQLRILQHRHAKKALKYAKTLRTTMQGLIELQQDIHAEATSIAGEYYKQFHGLSLELHGSNQSQVELDGFVTTPDLASVSKMADELVGFLEPVAGSKGPVSLRHEDKGSDIE